LEPKKSRDNDRGFVSGQTGIKKNLDAVTI